jgi:trans-aconitate methyltransferase
MKKNVHDSILNHYNQLFKKYGQNSKALGWINGRQSIRFGIVKDIGDFNNSTVLDVGCGFGDFYSYLKFRKIKCKYQGIDINSDFVEIAKKINPDGFFQVIDLQKKKMSQKFDWVVATGITNHAVSYPHLKNMLKEMFCIAKKGVVMDFISTYVDYKEKDIFYSSPEKVFKFAKTLTQRIALRHDYMPYEFCLYLYKNDKKNQKNIFQDYFNNIPKNLQTELWMKKNTK